MLPMSQGYCFWLLTDASSSLNNILITPPVSSLLPSSCPWNLFSYDSSVATCTCDTSSATYRVGLSSFPQLLHLPSLLLLFPARSSPSSLTQGFPFIDPTWWGPILFFPKVRITLACHLSSNSVLICALKSLAFFSSSTSIPSATSLSLNRHLPRVLGIYVAIQAMGEYKNPYSTINILIHVDTSLINSPLSPKPNTASAFEKDWNLPVVNSTAYPSTIVLTQKSTALVRLFSNCCSRVTSDGVQLQRAIVNPLAWVCPFSLLN